MEVLPVEVFFLMAGGPFVGGLIGWLSVGVIGALFGGLSALSTVLIGKLFAVLIRRLLPFVTRSRPLAAEVEVALRAVASGSWIELLHRLDTLQGERQDPTPWIAQLSDGNWQEQFLARHALAFLGGEAVEALRAHYSTPPYWLLKSIATETTRQLAPRMASLLCPRCFARCQQHRAQLKRGTITYYGCRVCRQSVEWLEAREVVAVLDSQMTLPWRQRDGRLYVDGLTRGASCDFDRIAVVHATDEAVGALLHAGG
jgi:hypothetical protein